jgi:hypothetical protein
LFSDYGKRATFLCPESGTYLAYSEDAASIGGFDELDFGSITPGTPDKMERIWSTRNSLKEFDLSGRLKKSS